MVHSLRWSESRGEDGRREEVRTDRAQEEEEERERTRIREIRTDERMDERTNEWTTERGGIAVRVRTANYFLSGSSAGLSVHPSCIPYVSSSFSVPSAVTVFLLACPLAPPSRARPLGLGSFISLDFKALKQVSKSRARKNRSASSPSFLPDSPSLFLLLLLLLLLPPLFPLLLFLPLPPPPTPPPLLLQIHRWML